MTTDFGARKLAKKRAKQHRAAESAENAGKDLGDGKPRRVRTKRGPNHRIRKGACFRPPPLPPGLAAEDEAAAAAERALKPHTGPTRRQRKRLRAAEAAEEAAGSEGEGESESEGGSDGELQPPPARPRAAKPAPGAAVTAELLFALTRLGHKEPTGVQAGVWAAAAAAAGDVLATDAPGTGKTLAYLLPALLRCHAAGGDAACGGGEDEPPAPRALVVLPARELTLQVLLQARKAAKALRCAAAVSCAAVHGGVPLDAHAGALAQRPPSLLIGTPARLRALLEAGALSLAGCTVLVLDEADKILKDAACSTDSAVLRDALPRPHQTLLLSATMPSFLASALREWLSSPARVVGAAAGERGCDGGGGGAEQPPAAPHAQPGAPGSGCGGAAVVSQDVQLCAEHKKPRKLLRFLDLLREQEKAVGARSRARVLIFTNTVKTARFVATLLERHGHQAGLLYGSRTQEEREQVLAAFRCGQLPLLVATDVAGRGLHITGLERVVNWDFPPNLEAYVHRVGRAGRAGCPGMALSFITRSFARLAPDLVRLLRQAGQQVEQNLGLLAQLVEEKLAAGELLLGEEEEGSGAPPAETVAAKRPREPKPPAASKAALKAVKAAKAPATGREWDEEKLIARKPLFSAPPPAAGDGEEDEDEPPPARKKKARTDKAPPGAAEPKPAAKPASQPARVAVAEAAFLASPRFAGAKRGYYFTKGKQGVGYYVDNKPQPSWVAPMQRGGSGGRGRGGSFR